MSCSAIQMRGRSFSKVAIAQRSLLVGRGEWLLLHHLVPLPFPPPPPSLTKSYLSWPTIFSWFCPPDSLPHPAEGERASDWAGLPDLYPPLTPLWARRIWFTTMHLKSWCLCLWIKDRICPIQNFAAQACFFKDLKWKFWAQCGAHLNMDTDCAALTNFLKL